MVQEEWGEKLAGQARLIWAVRAALTGLVIFPSGVIAAVLFGWLGLTTAIVSGISLLVVFLLVFCALLPQIRYRIWRYRITDDRIETRRGLLFRTFTSVPFARIQHADTNQGPLLRLFRLAHVQVYTASSVHVIPVLPIERAHSIRAQIVELTNRSGDDV
ncbi:PH domain-containing protein [Spirochaeta dissipatitropha]